MAPDSPEVLTRFNAELGLAETIARQIWITLGKTLELDDLVSSAREGLFDAARRFDATRGVPFRAYANFRVKGAVMDGVRQISTLPRRAHERIAAMEAAMAVSAGDTQVLFARPTQSLSDDEAEEYLDDQLGAMATAAAVSLVSDAMREGDGAEAQLQLNPEAAFLQAEAAEQVRKAIAELSTAERTVVERYYLRSERMDQIAREMNVNKSWVSRLHARAISRLSRRLLGEAPDG